MQLGIHSQVYIILMHGLQVPLSWFTHGLATSYLEGCNVFTAAVSTPPNCMGHSLLHVGFSWEVSGHLLVFMVSLVL